jgi:uncharacterized protein (TIGR04552 family)
LKQLGEFSLQDIEVVRLILRGGSVVDWHRLNFRSADEVKQFIRIHGLDPDAAEDRDYIRGIQEQAVRYLRRSFQCRIPASTEEADVVQLALMASAPGGHDQQSACAILKVMQIINHMAGRELLFRLPLSDRDLFHLVEEKVYRIVGTMLSEGFPITEFVGGRKNLDSTYTKLLSKRESTAVAIYDKLRFRIVTRSREELMPVLLYLSERLFPFNYVVPEQSTNTIFHFRSFCESHPHLSRFVPDLQITDQDALTPGDNRFSAPDYRTVQFIADLPVRVPDHLLELAPPGSEPLGKVVYMLCEIQLMDAETEASNEAGAANHRAYKDRQLAAVSRRLRLSLEGPEGG